jgi:peptide/nickel transport system substrate-binding protein
MRERNYWDRLQRQRITRRRLLGGTVALGAGAAGIALLGCGGDDGDEDGDGTTEPGATPTAQAQTLAVGTRGGILRYFGFDALTFDTLDPLQTQFGPIYNMHSAVFSKILKYDDTIAQAMSPDLADGMPEQPEPEGLVYNIKLRPGVTFHSTGQAAAAWPETAGRQLIADDVRFSIERQVNPDSPLKDSYYRKAQWETIDTIEVVDDLNLVITLKSPIAPFLHFLADRNAFIVPQEIVSEGDEMSEATQMLGTGPFVLEDYTAAQVVSVRRNPDWFAKDDLADTLGADRPFIEGYDALFTPQDDAAQEPALVQKQVDATGFNDDNNTARIDEENEGLGLSEIGIGGRIGVRLLTDRPPFQDVRVRRAMHLALDRNILGQAMFPAAPGRVGANPTGPIGWPMIRWALPPEELATMPGYRFADAAQRQEDISEAMALWQAAGGPASLGDALGAALPSYIPQQGKPEIVQKFAEVLDFNITINDVDYTQLASCLLRNQQDAPEGTCTFSFGFDNGWIDLDDWVFPFFKTGSAKNSFRLSDPTLDGMLDNQRTEFDYDARRELGYEIQRYLIQEGNDGMGVHADLPLICGITRTLRWSYVKNDFDTTWFGSSYLNANVWLDTADPNWQGRPA